MGIMGSTQATLFFLRGQQRRRASHCRFPVVVGLVLCLRPHLPSFVFSAPSNASALTLVPPPSRSARMPAQPSPSAELASAFAFFEADRDGRLQGSEICPVLRAVGFCPTEAEARALASAAGSEAITLPELQLLVATLVVPRLSSDAAAAPAAVSSALATFVELAGRGEGSMFTLTVQHNLDEVFARMDAMVERQIPFAAAKALTATAQDVQAELTAELPVVLDRPTPFTLNAFGIQTAR